jgi:hypothetical protein
VISRKWLLFGVGRLLCVLGLVGLVYLVWIFLVAWNLGDLASLARVFREEASRERDLEALIRLLGVYAEAKDQVAREVAAGQLSLVEGAARFRALCLETPGFDPALFRRFHGGNSDEECYCRALIDWVRRVLADDPAQAQKVASRLEAELQELVRNGIPSFPPQMACGLCRHFLGLFRLPTGPRRSAR